MPLVLSESDVRAALPIDDLVTAMESALAQLSAGAVVQPVRTAVEAPGGTLWVMPAFASQPAALGTKLVTLFPCNAARGLPSHLATIVLLDPGTGALLAILDGRYITEARTAAVSAVATKHLARSGSRRLAILGSGVQARSHLVTLSRILVLDDARVWSPTPDHRNRFAVEMRPLVGLEITAEATAEDAVRDADVIVLTTSATEPVLRSEWVAAGAHIVAVGAARPRHREMDSDLVARARVFVDSRAGALAEAGDILLPIAEGRFGADHITGELGEVVLGRIQGRTSDRQVTVFKSLGMAVEDVVAARLAYERAATKGTGSSVDL